MRDVIQSIEREFRSYRKLGDRAVAQLSDEEMDRAVSGANSVATVMRHVAGNLRSRFTDFLTSDGEKPWRDRESEFANTTLSRDALIEQWNAGWTTLLDTLAALDDSHLQSTVTIRSEPQAVLDALHRSLAHTSYHVGQIVFIARMLRGDAWEFLSIPPGGSAAFNESMKQKH
jgi:uncharacterized damage-inducible protein DinB